MYRGTWLLVGIPLLISAFTVSHPQPLRAPTLQPDFDGATAVQTAKAFVNNNPYRVPGTARAQQATNWVAQRFGQYGLRTQRERFHAKIPGRGTVQLENLLAFREGRSNQIIVVLAHRDNSGASPGANDNGSGTAALLELARSYATPQAPPRPPEPNHTILFLSTDGGAFGGLGAAYFAKHSPYRDRVVAVVDVDSIAGNGRPHLVFAGDEPRFASAALVRTGAARIAEQTGTAASRPGALAQLLDLAFPLSLYEQAPFVGHGVAALTLTSAGDRPRSAFGDTPERLNANRLTGIGRAGQALLGSLDDEVELAEGTSSYVYLGARVVRGWSIVLILFAALLPALAVIVDLFARLRRRHLPLAPALRSLRSRLLFWLFAVLLFDFVVAVPRLQSAVPHLDKAHTRIGFTVSHLVISHVSGAFRDFNGTINYDPGDVTKSTVDVHIMAASVNTGDDKRDGHLKSPDFFDVQKFSELTFKSTKIGKKGDGFVEYGPLTIHGVTKDVELPFTIAGTIKDGMGKTHLVAQSSITINRKRLWPNLE